MSQEGRHSIKYVPYKPLYYKDHDDKNMKLNRPMSPHMTVYAPTLPAMTSIGQRAAGSILTCYAFLLSAGTLILPDGIETYVHWFHGLHLGFFSSFTFKIILGLPFFFHYFNGIRYAAWNQAKLLSIDKVYSTARMAMIAAVVASIFFAIF